MATHNSASAGVRRGKPLASIAIFFMHLAQLLRSAPLWLRTSALLLVTMLGLSLPAEAQPLPVKGQAVRFEIGANDYLVDGAPFLIHCGEVHFPRVPREYWRHRLQMIRALGLNTVSVYLFWNYHEEQPGVFDWTGNRDAAEFCRLAQEEGLWVILRPGPYVCAEWDGGGLPWWLLKDDANILRTRDPRFMGPVRSWFKEVYRQLGGLQASKGGPILMIQVENEYGYFGHDKDYVKEVRQGLLDAGFTQPTFVCNANWVIKEAHTDGMFSVVNFGSDPAGAFKALRAVQPTGPLTCGEYYPGWFDTWGQPHHTGSMANLVTDLSKMIEMHASFSLYMAHGGTTFGLRAGADRPFRPDTTSYDYDAPIDEAGRVTPKFAKVRALLAAQQPPGTSLPEPPAANPAIAIPEIRFDASAPLTAIAPTKTVTHTQTLTFEKNDVARGVGIYRTTIPAGPAGWFEVAEIRDIAWVTLAGKPIGVLDRRAPMLRVELPERSTPQILECTLLTLGRVNFGWESHDRKGLYSPHLLLSDGNKPLPLDDWDIRFFELRDTPPADVTWGTAASGAGWHRARFKLAKTGDTYLDVSHLGFGILWLNGHCLGRYWNIGPTQTMYVPAPWLRDGENEIVRLEFLDTPSATLRGLDAPILDQRHTENDFARLRAKGRLVLNTADEVASGVLPDGGDIANIALSSARTCPQLCFEIDSVHGSEASAAIAELQILDAAGNPLNQTLWSIAYVSSEELDEMSGAAENAINGQAADFWQTRKGATGFEKAKLVIDLGRPETIAAVRYTPKPGDAKTQGRVERYRIYAGDRLFQP